MSIIVIEGADGTGKTTLAGVLEKRGFEYRHQGPPLNGVNLFQHYADELLSCRGKKVVMDRLHVGELIYGPVMRGKSLITVEELRLLNRLLFGLGGKVIFCDTDDAVIERNWLRRRGQEYLDDADKLYEVMFQYRRLFDQEFTADDHHVYDYRTSVVNKLLESMTEPSSLPEGVIGHPRNRFLFIGEKANGLPDLPFFTMDNSSGYLNKCLWAAGYKEHELAFTNAGSFRGIPRELYPIWDQNRQQVVVTLGKVAHEACVNQAVPHLEAPHPSYVKRFDSKKIGKYIELLNRFRGEV